MINLKIGPIVFFVPTFLLCPEKALFFRNIYRFSLVLRTFLYCLSKKVREEKMGVQLVCILHGLDNSGAVRGSALRCLWGFQWRGCMLGVQRRGWTSHSLNLDFESVCSTAETLARRSGTNSITNSWLAEEQAVCRLKGKQDKTKHYCFLRETARSDPFFLRISHLLKEHLKLPK